MSRARFAGWIVALCFVAAFALPVHTFSCGTQASHYALVQSLAKGTARIDDVHEITCDKAWFDGHFYSVKAPGLAVMSLPVYLALERTGLLPDDPRWAIWLLSLTTLLPLALLLVHLTRRIASEIAPEETRLTVVALAAGTIVLPFSSLWFGHVPAAALALAAYVVVRQARERPPRQAGIAAGLLAGVAVLFEYPVALVSVALVAYAVATRGRRFAAWMCAGAALPAAALLAYNRWAFGSILHFSYERAVIITGDTGHDVVGANDGGFFGISRPSVHALLDLLFSPRGLLTLTPVCLVGAAGVVLLYRRARADALVAASLVLVFLVYNSGYTLSFGGPFGGDVPGPRFLTAVLPFLLLPVGLAAARWPGPTVALLGVSVATMTLATATAPMVGEGEADRWTELLRDGAFVHTPLSALDGRHGWLQVAPFAIAVATLLGLAVAQLAGALRAAPARAAAGAGIALLGWIGVYALAHETYADRVAPAPHRVGPHARPACAPLPALVAGGAHLRCGPQPRSVDGAGRS